MGVFAAPTPVATVIDITDVTQMAEVAICVMAAMFVLRLELQRRFGDVGPGWRYGFSGSIEGCKQILKHCGPEVAGVVACLTLALLLRFRNNPDNNLDPDQMDQWEEIKAQWPLLLTADTLLSFQSMLRLVGLCSVLLRAGGKRPVVPLADEVAVLSFFANVARGLLVWKSSSYMLDGPLGGNLPACCDVLAIPLLAALGALSTLRRCPLVLAAVSGGVMWLSSRHHLCLGEDGTTADMLFVAAHMFDTLSALTYLVRSLLISENDRAVGCIKVGFTHLLMTAQQSLSTYYFLRAFDTDSGLVGAGLPFQILHIGNAVQLGTYFAAAVLFTVEQFDNPVAVPTSARTASGSSDTNSVSHISGAASAVGAASTHTGIIL